MNTFHVTDKNNSTCETHSKSLQKALEHQTNFLKTNRMVEVDKRSCYIYYSLLMNSAGCSSNFIVEFEHNFYWLVSVARSTTSFLYEQCFFHLSLSVA